MRFPDPRRIATNGIELAVHSVGSGPPVVLCHGFPELAYSWRYQLPALAAAGFTAHAPDMRGFGQSDKPQGVEKYDIRTLCADLCGLLDNLDLGQALFVGHDWGAILLWQFALLYPERVQALVNMNVPFYPRTPVDPVPKMREILSDDFYIANFQLSREADDAFDADPQRFFESVMRRRPITREQFDAIPASKKRPYSMLRSMRKSTFPGEPLLSNEDLQVFVEAYRNGGFTPPINWYRNWTRNWEITEGVTQRVTVPTLFIGARDDVLIAPHHIEAMHRYVDKLDVVMIDECGHWTQQEKPDEVNRLLVGWLNQYKH
ncbi:MAG: alpha/beta hydrolase [Pseudomonadota bacterium]